MNGLLPARIALFVLLAHFSSLASAAICYVNFEAPGSNNGTSWGHAYFNPQSALANPACTQIWIARGTYKPTATTDRTISFNIKPGVIVYGGFAGTEASFSERFVPAHPTILSGDIGVEGDSSDNSYHVVVMDGTTASGSILASTVLAYVTVSDGNANGAGANEGIGGGLYCNGQGAGHQCSPQLAAVIFENNSAGAGGAIYSDGHGGGGSSPYLHDAIVRNNTATGLGGGGGMHNDGSGGTSSPVVEKTTFTGNSGGLGGGAMYNDGTAGVSSPTVSNSTFHANTAVLGGAMLNYGLTAGHASPVLRYVTFYQNKATGGPGGAIYNFAPTGDAAPNISGAIFWADQATGVPVENYANSQTASSLEYSITPECPPAAVGCINADPLLDPLQNSGGFAPTLRPGIGSPAIDNGNAANCPAADERGITRPQGTKCDLGAVELVPAETQRCYVKRFILPPNDGKSWASAYEYLTYALADPTCGEVWVANGTYKPAILGADRTNAFFMPPGKAVYGGFAGNETARSQRDPTTNVTILSGEIGAPDISDNSYHVVVIDAFGAATNITDSTRLDGFTITAGNANGSDAAALQQYGGGLICNGNGNGTTGYTCNPTLANLVFNNNNAVYGGALFNLGTEGGMSSPRLQTVTFSANHAVEDGGAVYNAGANHGVASPTLTAVDFIGNTAHNAGAMLNSGAGVVRPYGASSPSVVASHFDGNEATNIGGAVYNDAAHPSFTDVTFSGNHSLISGAVYNSDTNGPILAQFTSVTFSGNYAQYYGGAVFNDLFRAEFNNARGASLVRFDHVVFEDNSVTTRDAGGAVFNTGQAEFRDVLFARNGGAHWGGAIANIPTKSQEVAMLTIDGASFVGNEAWRGGAVYSEQGNSSVTGTALISNATFWRNTSSFDGGAITNLAGSMVLRNVTFGSNSSPQGGALAVDVNDTGGIPSTTISNTILWGDSTNSDGEIHFWAGTTAAIDHSIAQNGCPAGSTCSAVSSADPLLGPFQLYGGFTPARMPGANSPALDFAENCPATDQRGVGRPQGAGCDIGALERRAVGDVDYLFNNGFDL